MLMVSHKTINLEDAANSYEALKIKPDETYPKEKISSLQAIIDKNIETDQTLQRSYKFGW